METRKPGQSAAQRLYSRRRARPSTLNRRVSSDDLAIADAMLEELASGQWRDAETVAEIKKASA